MGSQSLERRRKGRSGRWRRSPIYFATTITGGSTPWRYNVDCCASHDRFGHQAASNAERHCKPLSRRLFDDERKLDRCACEHLERLQWAVRFAS